MTFMQRLINANAAQGRLYNVALTSTLCELTNCFVHNLQISLFIYLFLFYVRFFFLQQIFNLLVVRGMSNVDPRHYTIDGLY